MPEGPAASERLKLADAALASFVAIAPASRQLLEQIQKVAAADSTVLITGESGTGKDLVASLLHYLGPHPAEPLVKIDCAGLPDELLESELFGYERGAFTGAMQTKRGRLELAGHGTLVLDEVAALPVPAQPKLLRVLEDRSFLRLGGTRSVKVVARIVATTSIDLGQAVQQRSFREDLFFRLNVVPLNLSPLRARREDIIPLAKHLLRQIGERLARKVTLSSGALALLEQHDFPGNIRELRNLLERAATLSQSAEIGAADLAHLRASDGQAPDLTLAALERRHIAEVLERTRGRKSKAAELLGISRKNLLEKRKRYKLD